MLNELEHLRFSYEIDLFRTISSRFGQFPFLGSVKSRNLLDARRRELLGDAVRVTNDLLPDIYDIYQSCLNLLGGDLSGDLFVKQSKDYNASVFAHNNKFDILIHSALIKDFTADELRFVFGHELGHVVFEHNRFPILNILAKTKKVNQDLTNLLFRWSRAVEVSADRVGLLCCGQLAAAVTALFQTSSGLSDISVDRVLRSFRKQYDVLQEHIEEFSDINSWIRTHPMIPIRFKAMELVALDIIALRHQPKRFSNKGFIEMDRQIANLLKELDMKSGPTYFL